jgi:hypothetical protein
MTGLGKQRRKSDWRWQMIKILKITFLFLIIFAPQIYSSPRYTAFPQFVSGQGWSSELYFTNQGLSRVSEIAVIFYSSSGQSINVETNMGTAASFVFNLEAGATQVIRAIPSSTFIEGYAIIRYPWTGSPVRATEIFRYEQNGMVKVKAGVPQQERGDHFCFPAEESASQLIHTAIAIVNPKEFNTTDQTFIVNLIRPDGSTQATNIVTIQSGQQLTGYLNEPWLFPDLNNFTGSVSISSPLGVGVLAVRQDRESFGGIPTDGGPVLRPFAISGPNLQALEPDDDPASAMFLTGSAKISGTIGMPGDMDHFSFTGKRGDIISVICDAQESGSYLDSVIEIYNSSSILVAQNDQNGLAPQLYPINDSFIQMVLPTDDTYYIRVSDYYGDGGANYGYSLHVKLP